MPLLLLLTAIAVWSIRLMGLDNANSPLYLFWSGFFPDIVLIAGAWTWVRHHRCQKDDCRYKHLPVRRIAVHAYEGHMLCRHHHPGAHRLNNSALAHLWRHHREHAVVPHGHECAGGPAEAALIAALREREG